jgi:hypothetical protein
MANIKVDVIENPKSGEISVVIDGTNFGSFELLPESSYSYHAKLQHELSGDHYIAIGKALNKYNKKNIR